MALNLHKVEISCFVMSCRPSKDGKAYFLGCTQDFGSMFTIISDKPVAVEPNHPQEKSFLCRIYCGLNKNGEYKENVFVVA